MMIRRLLLAVWLAAVATVAHATSPSFVQWQMTDTGNPSTVSIRDRNGVFVTFGLIDSTAHTFSTSGITVSCPTLPALTGDVTSSAGSCVTTIAAGAVTGSKIASATITGANIAANTIANSNLSQMATLTIKGNVTGGSATPVDLTGGQAGVILCTPVYQIINVVGGSSGTYTTPTCNGITAHYLEIVFVGAGGGGGGSGTPSTGGNGAAGGLSSFGTALYSATGGAPGLKGTAAISAGGVGGVGSGCTDNLTGQQGSASSATGFFMPASGGSAVKWGIGGTSQPATAGQDGMQGGGAAGGASASGVDGGGAGGGGGYCWVAVISPAATYAYVQGAGGVAGTAGTSGFVGGTGGDGYISITARWQ